MPSPKHEALIELFRRQPMLALRLLRDVAHLKLPEFTELRVVSEQMSDLRPATYHADLVVVLYKGKPILCIVVEVQLRRNQSKRYSWPVYLVHQHARFRCPVVLLVVCPIVVGSVNVQRVGVAHRGDPPT
jgi:ABC-type hemin transport system ATPase subunit